MSKKITAFNSSKDGDKCTCYFTGKEFTTGKGIVYMFNGMTVSEAEALKQGFEFADDFRLPGNINTRVAVMDYLQQGLKISRVSPSYLPALQKLCEGLPAGDRPKYEKPEYGK